MPLPLLQSLLGFYPLNRFCSTCIKVESFGKLLLIRWDFGKAAKWEPHFQVALDHQNGQCLNYYLGSFQVHKCMGKREPASTVMINCRVIDGNFKTICQVEVWGEKKWARDLKQLCWVLASHVDQELNWVVLEQSQWK